jgi:hypothetical protein
VKSRLWVYTEDTAEDAPEVLKALVKRLLQQLSPGLPTNLLALFGAPHRRPRPRWLGIDTTGAAIWPNAARL